MNIPRDSLLDIVEEYERRSARRNASTEPNVDVPIFLERLVGRICDEIPDDDPAIADRCLLAMRSLYEKDLILTNGVVRLKEILVSCVRSLVT